jgi:hypothetical protein
LSFAFLGFELTQALGLRALNAAELDAPPVKSSTAEAAISVQLLDRHARLGLIEEADDLFLAESALLHIRHSPGG